MSDEATSIQDDFHNAKLFSRLELDDKLSTRSEGPPREGDSGRSLPLFLARKVVWHVYLVSELGWELCVLTLRIHHSWFPTINSRPGKRLLIWVAACDQDRPVWEHQRDRMIQSSDGGGASAVPFVENRIVDQSSIGREIGHAKSLSALHSSINPEDLAVEQVDAFHHDSTLRHVGHLPLGILADRLYPPTRSFRRTSVGVVASATTDHDLWLIIVSFGQA